MLYRCSGEVVRGKRLRRQGEGRPVGLGENETGCGCSVCVVRGEAVLGVFGDGGVGSEKGWRHRRGEEKEAEG